jgi:hypothetical protein
MMEKGNGKIVFVRSVEFLFPGQNISIAVHAFFPSNQKNAQGDGRHHGLWKSGIK